MSHFKFYSAVIHDLSLSSQLSENWIYSDDNPDIYIIDLDSGYTNILIPKKIKIVLSNNPELLKGGRVKLEVRHKPPN